eukprot:scpid94008/ scgid9604/ 
MASDAAVVTPTVCHRNLPPRDHNHHDNREPCGDGRMQQPPAAGLYIKKMAARINGGSQARLCVAARASWPLPLSPVVLPVVLLVAVLLDVGDSDGMLTGAGVLPVLKQKGSVGIEQFIPGWLRPDVDVGVSPSFHIHCGSPNSSPFVKPSSSLSSLHMSAHRVAGAA